mgnify:CR=1 FL=1
MRIFLALLAFLFVSNAFGDVSAVFDGFHQKLGGDESARIRLITENQAAWYARWHIVDNAKETIDCTYFIIEDDIFGRSFLGLLHKKARQGIKLRFMVDARGTLGYSHSFMGRDYLQELAEYNNVEIKVFNPLTSNFLKIFRNLRNPVASNHDKIIMVDNRWVVIGGRNISKDYMAALEDHKGAWRDTDVLIDSAIVAEHAQLAFTEEFAQLDNHKVKEDFIDFSSKRLDLELARRLMFSHMMNSNLSTVDDLQCADKCQWIIEELEGLPSLRAYQGYRPFEGQRTYPVCVLDKHSFKGRRNDITQNLVDLMDGAKKTIYIQNPYIVLTKEAEAALLRASDRGVKIVISTNSPASTDSMLTQAFFLKDWKMMMADMPTLQIHCFQGGTQLHAKVFTFDDEVAVIGTYNMDPLSEQVNSEVCVAVKSPSFARRNRLRIEADMAHSIEYKIEIDENGAVKPVVGPMSHVKEELLDKVTFLQKFPFLRSLI